MILVLDASVAIKWFLHFREDEAHCRRALDILTGVDEGRIVMMQPPHFLAEMGAVLAREKPADALSDLKDLMAVEFQSATEPAVYEAACKLAVRLGQHLFDTLYHAVALHTPGATLVTADTRYFSKARDVGRITLLADFIP